MRKNFKKLALITYNTKLKYNLMGFYRKYNTIIRSIDNLTKLYKLSKKKKSESKKEDKKWGLFFGVISTAPIHI